MFRPEMLLPMGLPEDVTVIAWGLSLERYIVCLCVCVWVGAAGVGWGGGGGLSLIPYGLVMRVILVLGKIFDHI